MGKIGAPGGKKSWALNCVDFAQGRKEAENFGKELGISPILAQILMNRGYTDAAEADAFLGKKSELLCDPFELVDIEKAVSRLISAVENREKIVVYGDYDVDGVTSVTALVTYLTECGADVSYFIPSRLGDGYGLARGSIDSLAESGAKLIVTVDTGITACEEAEYTNSLGIDLIITDHHECRPVLPTAVAIVNPRRPDCKYPFKYLAGVGVVFKLICALECSLNPDVDKIDSIRRICSSYADLVALGTIADVMPVTGENRLIVSLGLSMIEKTKRPGIKALIDAANSPEGGAPSKSAKKRKITSGYIGYTIAPRINAAGRIADAKIAAELLLSKDSATAAYLADKLCEINRKRQTEENRIAEEAYSRIAAECDVESDRIIVLADDNWHQGIIGIVASRISEKYNLPAILVSFEGSDGEIGKGSGRSIGNINLVDALTACGDLLTKYGGHALAAGLSVTRENLGAFKKQINGYIKDKYPEYDSCPELAAEMELEPSDINMSNVEDLGRLEPYGVSNPTPSFIMRNLQVEDITSVGANKHTKLMLGRDGMSFPALCFGTGPDELDIVRGDRIDVFFNLDINEFQNVRTVQLIVRDIALTGREAETFSAENEYHRQLQKNGYANAGRAYIPTRDSFASMYTYLRKRIETGHDTVGIRAASLQTGLSTVTVRIILSVFAEMGLISLESQNEEAEKFALAESGRKVDLESSKIMKALKNGGEMQ